MECVMRVDLVLYLLYDVAVAAFVRYGPSLLLYSKYTNIVVGQGTQAYTCSCHAVHRSMA
jgi:hypothetical protein